jgi:predicted MFS family arabinose efflux permease
MVAPWFDRDRPKAIGLAFNGASVAGIVFPPLLVQGTASIGLQATAILVAIAVLLVVGSLAHFYLRKVPADLGLTADGGPPMMPGSKPAPVQRLPRSSLIRTREFQTLNVAFALALFAQVGLLSHLITRVSPVFGASGAALAVSLTTISAVAGRTLLGWLIGDHDRRIAACGNFLVQSVGVGLICISDTPSAVLVGCVLFGLGVGNVVSLPTLIAQKEFRSPDVGTVVALVVAINQAVFALAPAILGTIRDVTASYTAPFAIGIAAQIMASFIVLVGRRHRAADEG